MAWDPEAIVKAAIAVAAPLATIVGLAGRRRRLRNEIRENLVLVEALEQNEVLREHTPAAGWLQGRIALDVAKLSGQPLGTPKKPVPKGSVAAAAVVGLAFAAWTYLINRNGFVWYSVFPGIVSALMFISILGMFTNRELPLDQDDSLPEGAVPIRNETASEQVVAAAAVGATGIDERFDDEAQIGVAFRFLRTMKDGRYEDGLLLADENWLLCRIQAWLWNNQSHFGSDVSALQAVAESLVHDRARAKDWQDFVATESAAFIGAWGSLDPDKFGAGSRRRRIAPDYDLVVLAPVGESGGYFVNTATVLPNALVFVMRHRDGRWLVASHLGTAPPQPGWPGWPPAWWTANDPVVEKLP